MEENPNHKMPSTWEMAVGLNDAIKDTFKRLVALDILLAPKEIAEKRWAICNSCEFFAAENHHRCSKCGCAMIIKVRLQGLSCPINKWTE